LEDERLFFINLCSSCSLHIYLRSYLDWRQRSDFYGLRVKLPPI